MKRSPWLNLLIIVFTLGGTWYFFSSVVGGYNFGVKTGMNPVVTMAISSVFVIILIALLWFIFKPTPQGDLYECSYCRKRIYGLKEVKEHEKECKRKKK